MAKAGRELRSTDEGYARDAVVWLKGYLMALDDVEGSRIVTHGAEKLNDQAHTSADTPKSQARCVQPLVRCFRCLGMDSLDRMIRYGDKDAEECRHEWRVRYNHDWPVYAVTNGKEQTI